MEQFTAEQVYTQHKHWGNVDKSCLVWIKSQNALGGYLAAAAAADVVRLLAVKDRL